MSASVSRGPRTAQARPAAGKRLRPVHVEVGLPRALVGGEMTELLARPLKPSRLEDQTCPHQPRCPDALAASRWQELVVNGPATW
jgi:hypothetical protein